MLIGVTGKKRAGKDSVANRLVAHHGFTRVAFADPLKAAALDIDPVLWEDESSTPVRLSNVVEDHGWEMAKEKHEVRRFLQALGVAIRDHVDQDVWVNAGVAVASRLLEQGKSVVITDVRFPNELDAVRDLGGLHFHVERPGLVSTDTHVSETALEPYYNEAEAIVVNAGTLDDLTQAVDDALAVVATP